MTLQKKTQLPISTGGGHKSDVRTQFAALCYKVVDGETRVLLVTSRRSGRWIVPKGWPVHQMRPAAAAMKEAYEEAGVEGKVIDFCLGLYSYQKTLEEDEDLPCIAAIFPVKVKKLLKKYPEVGQRKRRWFSLAKAAQKVDEPELSRIIKTFDPQLLPY